jgi:rhamnosyltransferase
MRCGLDSNRACGIVVTYHPTAAHLNNLRSLRPQVDHLIVVDNGSSDEILTRIRALRDELNLVLVENAENMGIAFALNQGVQHAFNLGCKWINLFDQDSQVTEQYIDTMIEDFEHLSKSLPLGLLVPRYRTPVGGSERFFSSEGKIGPFVTITSGSLFKDDVLRACGPFAEELFIYGVDDEYSLRLRLRKFEIAQSKRAVLLHAAGDPQPVRAFGIELFTKTNHSALSRYYLNRNRIWLARRYARSYPAFFVGLAVSSLKDVLKIILAEPHKAIKLKRMAEGFRDGFLGRMGKATCLELQR